MTAVSAVFSNKKRKIKDKSKKIKVFKKGNVCPLITRMNTNEYFAVNLILRHKIKLTANGSVLLVLPLCGMPFVVKKGFLCVPATAGCHPRIIPSSPILTPGFHE